MNLLPSSPSQRIIQRAAHAVIAWEEHSSFAARLAAGELKREEYAAWLVQMHHYIRHSVSEEHALAVAMAARAEHDPWAAEIAEYARWEAEEEAGHDELIVDDLAALWGVGRDEARGRLEREPLAPSVVAWNGMVNDMMARYPEGVVGFALTLETIASLTTDRIRVGLLERGEVFAVAQAVSFLSAHSSAVEGSHSREGARVADLFVSPQARSAVHYYAAVALALYEGILQFLEERFPARADEGEIDEPRGDV